MSSPASIAKHPIHPMLIVFPIGLWGFSLLSDVILLLGGNVRWADVALYTMAGGLVGALIAAVPGIVDFFSIGDPQAKKVGWYHMILNLIAVAIFAVNLYLRLDSAPGAALPVILSAAGILFVAVSGWLGGELVYVHGVGVSRSYVAPKSAEQEPIRLRRLR